MRNKAGKIVALSQALIPGAVNGWLDDHPEATTTVQDGAITKAKLNASLQETVDDVSGLKSALNDTDNGLYPIPIVKNSYVKQNGDIAAYPGWDRTDYIPCVPGEKIYLYNSTQTSYCFWYNASKEKVMQLILSTGDLVITPPSNAYYFMISNTTAAMSQLKIRCLARYTELKKEISVVDNKFEVLEQKVPIKNTINLFNTSTITEGKYLSTTTGNLLSGSGFFASDFIYVGDFETVKVSKTHIVCWYDESKAFVSCPESMDSGTNDITLTVPSGVKYLRFSAYDANLNSAQVGENISRDNYYAYGLFTLSGLITDGDNIVVASDGSGDYTSFTLACKENYGNAKDIIVKPGTYNIVLEYVAIWGQDAVDGMADADNETFDGWQYGVKLNGRKYTFLPGAKLVCDWTGHTVNGTHRFSALRVEKNVEIIGLDLDGTNLFYVIHDDYGDNNSQYTNIYRNCRVIGHNISNANCIGGGCKKYSRHIIENCYFDNGGLASSTTVRYHNTNAEGAVPELFISNSFFNGWVTPRYYGTQTSKMRAYINNCKAQKIAVIAESGSYTTENVDLYKWCNEEEE